MITRSKHSQQTKESSDIESCLLGATDIDGETHSSKSIGKFTGIYKIQMLSKTYTIKFIRSKRI